MNQNYKFNNFNKETKTALLLAKEKDMGLIKDTTPGFTNNKELMNYMKKHIKDSK